MTRNQLGVGMAALGVAMLAAVPRVQAAPQILGLVATSVPAELRCEGGVCRATLSSFCLQKHRKSPSIHTVYRAARPEQLTLVIKGRDGRERRLPAADHISVQGWRTNTAVLVSLNDSTLKELGGVSAAIEVAPMASLVPMAEPNDAAPLTADEIAQYTGPLRRRAETVFAEGSAPVLAAGIAHDMELTLPPSQGVTPAEADAAWQRALQHLPVTPAAAAARTVMAREFRDCRAIARYAAPGYDPDANSIHACMGTVHDELMQDLTEEVWQRLEPGG